MIQKKAKLFDKIIKRDYSNELEEILTYKPYSEDVKNLLLDILYKIENSYGDYKTVKINVLPKEKYVQNIIDIIKKDCDSIKFIKENTFYIDYDKKEIKCYPIERKLLYAISKIQKSTDIVKTEEDLINKTLTNVINAGNNINMVEPIRDFNGFSWNISVEEIDNLYYNLIYQDLIVLIGNKFLEEWTNKNESIIDYMTLFQSDLEANYGRHFSKEIIKLLKKLSVLIEVNNKEEIRQEIQDKKEYLEKQLEYMSNMEKCLLEICNEKKQIENELKKIDIMLNDKALLQEEYKKRNLELPIDKKIFSTRILSNILKDERKEKMEKISKYNFLMSPKNFRNIQKNYKEEYEYLKLVDSKNFDTDIIENILDLQKEILKSFRIKIMKSNSKEELMKTMYEFRYFCLIPITKRQNLASSKKLARLNTMVVKEFYKKAEKLKLINKIFKDENKNIAILKKVFSLKIISLDDIYLKIYNEKRNTYLQFYDENVIDEKFPIKRELKKSDLEIKLNKKVKLFVKTKERIKK